MRLMWGLWCFWALCTSFAYFSPVLLYYPQHALIVLHIIENRWAVPCTDSVLWIPNPTSHTCRLIYTSAVEQMLIQRHRCADCLHTLHLSKLVWAETGDFHQLWWCRSMRRLINDDKFPMEVTWGLCWSWYPAMRQTRLIKRPRLTGDGVNGLYSPLKQTKKKSC